MNFTTVVFLFFLMPITLLYYFAAIYIDKNNLKNKILLFASLIFYSWGGIQYLLLLFLVIIVNYWFVIQIIKNKSKKILSVSIIMNVFILVIFKYTTFVLENIGALLKIVGINNENLLIPNIPLPLGISFITFQIIALLVDAYKGKFEKITLLEVALFITFFPQLLQGPILRYNDIVNEIRERKITIYNIELGIKRFIQGFGKKILIADSLTPISDKIFEMSVNGISNIYAWIGIFCYSFVIYYDFSGYSDMAIGLCKIFGFHIPENFNYPYISKSIQEFWRRWHISLSSWFRDYIYIPLGGNRGGTICTYRNLIIVFLLTGIWHGAQWTFIIWGLFHGFFMLIERIGLKNVLNKIPAFFSHLYCIVIVLIGWVFFRAENLEQALNYLKCMFIPNDITWLNIELLEKLDFKFIFIFVIAIVLSMPAIRNFLNKVEEKYDGFIIKAIYLMYFVVSISAMLGGSFNPSIYAKF